MLDSPEKITRLMATLKAAVPFDVELPPSTLARLKAKKPSLAVKTNETVFSVTYEPSYGGIVCPIRPTGTDDLLATSLTHVRVRGSEPFDSRLSETSSEKAQEAGPDVDRILLADRSRSLPRPCASRITTTSTRRSHTRTSDSPGR